MDVFKAVQRIIIVSQCCNRNDQEHPLFTDSESGTWSSTSSLLNRAGIADDQTDTLSMSSDQSHPSRTPF